MFARTIHDNHTNKRGHLRTPSHTSRVRIENKTKNDEQSYIHRLLRNGTFIVAPISYCVWGLVPETMHFAYQVEFVVSQTPTHLQILLNQLFVCREFLPPFLDALLIKSEHRFFRSGAGTLTRHTIQASPHPVAFNRARLIIRIVIPTAAATIQTRKEFSNVDSMTPVLLQVGLEVFVRSARNLQST
jgi:hypothetical protein